MSSSLGSNKGTTAAVSIAAVAGLLGTLYYLDIPRLLQQRRRSRRVESRCYNLHEAPSLTTFKALTTQVALRETYPLASDIRENLPIYNAQSFDLNDHDFVSNVQDEFSHILLHGPGVFVLKSFFPDPKILDAANTAFATILAHERTNLTPAGDHFAPASANRRIWNSFSKHALTDAENFLQYYSNPLFALVSHAHLGPGYRITAQLNVVRPGGAAQTVHRDYHLGFQTAAAAVQWPRNAHAASASLTLQGGIAHTAMPAESGPTRFLPFSQQCVEGYLAFRRPEFDAYFREEHVSVPMEKGDAVFFSPAIFHAAGENRTEHVERSANLVQISSAFGKPMETVDALPLIEATFDQLRAKFRAEGWSAEVDAFVRAVAEGYPFPTNLDHCPPAPGGLAPESEQDILRKALGEGWDKEKVRRELLQMRQGAAA